MDDKLKVINFIQYFGCATLKQLQILFNKPNDNFKDILSSNVISRKGDIFVHKGFEPVYITFLSKENLLYNIIVTDKSSEKGILKLIKTNSPAIPEADKCILLFEDDSCQKEVVCNTPFTYCVYPSMKILNKRPK